MPNIRGCYLLTILLNHNYECTWHLLEEKKKTLHTPIHQLLLKLTSVRLLTAWNKRQAFHLQTPDRSLNCFAQITACKGCILAKDYLWQLPRTEVCAHQGKRGHFRLWSWLRWKGLLIEMSVKQRSFSTWVNQLLLHDPTTQDLQPLSLEVDLHLKGRVSKREVAVYPSDLQSCSSVQKNK